MDEEPETDYLVVGAGAAGMAFTDAVLAHSDATVTIVDRRHAPGGHWVDAYPYVRLHQPSTFYGVDSVPLGQDAVDATGTDAGFYERAGADELRAYFARVMERHFLPTGRVRYFPGSDYTGEDRFVSRVTGASRRVRVRRKLVDTTYLEGELPATSPPPFEVADGVRVVTPGELARLDDHPDRFVIIGAGKTALDTCVWLVEQGVSPSAIRWIRPREARWLNRRFQLEEEAGHGLSPAPRRAGRATPGCEASRRTRSARSPSERWTSSWAFSPTTAGRRGVSSVPHRVPSTGGGDRCNKGAYGGFSMTFRGAIRTALVVTCMSSVTVGVSLISCGSKKAPATGAWSPNQGPPPPPPSSGPSGGGGCSKDTDCKGDRICDRGTCRAP